MPKLKQVGQALTEAMHFSQRLEERRGNIADFELLRLARMACPQEGNYQQHLAKEMLVAEAERDFERFDRAADHFLMQTISWDLAANMATIALFSFNPDVSLQLTRRALEIQPDNVDLIDFCADCAWFTGDLELCADLRERTERLGAEMTKDLRDIEARHILEDVGVPVERYQRLIRGLHGLLREHFTSAMNKNVELHFDTAHHEDGSSSIVLEVLTDLDDEAFDRLDDAVLEYSSDIDRWGYDLMRATTLLVRDMPASLAEGAA